MIDDRPEVMAHMPPSVWLKILFNPHPAEVAAFWDQLQAFSVAKTWLDVERLLLRP